VLGLDFKRVQFTPDMLPADLTGAMVLDLATGEPSFRPGPVFIGLEAVQLHPDLLRYVVALVAATRSRPRVTVGASPRGTLAVIQLARGHAALDGREFVTPEDIKAVAVPALAHRLVLRPEMWVRQVTGQDVAAEVLATVPVPRSPG